MPKAWFKCVCLVLCRQVAFSEVPIQPPPPFGIMGLFKVPFLGRPEGHMTSTSDAGLLLAFWAAHRGSKCLYSKVLWRAKTLGSPQLEWVSVLLAASCSEIFTVWKTPCFPGILFEDHCLCNLCSFTWTFGAAGTRSMLQQGQYALSHPSSKVLSHPSSTALPQGFRLESWCPDSGYH